MLAELGVLLLLVLVNGVLAGAEIAVVSVDSTRLGQLVREGSRRARLLDALRKNPERFFAAVQIGITFVSATAGAFGGARFAARLEPLVARVPILREAAPQVSFVFVVITISFLSIVFGELVPKSLALRHARLYALAVSPLVHGLAQLARPAVWVFTTASNAVLSLFGDRTSFSESRLSPEDLQRVVSEATESGSIHPAAGEIASRAFVFADLRAVDVMVPRARVVGVPRSGSASDLQRIVTETGYSRLPVYGENLDEIHGYVLVKDFLSMAWERQLIVLEDLIRPAYFVVESVGALGLLHEMRARRVHLAVVVDEHGGTSGIVTMEDLLEELVGEIFSEVAESGEPVHRMEDGSVIVPGALALRDLDRELGIELPEGDEWSTVGGLCLVVAGRVPRQGEALTLPDGTRLEIESATDRSVTRVRVRPVARAAAANTEAASRGG